MKALIIILYILVIALWIALIWLVRTIKKIREANSEIMAKVNKQATQIAAHKNAVNKSLGELDAKIKGIINFPMKKDNTVG